MRAAYDITNLVIAVSGLMICILGLIQSLLSRHLKKNTRIYFIVFFVLMSAYVTSNLVSQLAAVGTGRLWVIVNQLSIFLESAFSSVLLIILSDFILYSSGQRERWRDPVFRLIQLLWIVYIVLLVYTQFSVSIYYFDADNVYHRGPLYPLLLVPPALIMVLNLVLLLRRRACLTRKENAAFALYIILPLICMVIQMMFYGLYVIVFGTAAAAVLMFIFIQSDQTDSLLRQEEENARLKIDTLLAQIQPHFLYNSLTAIRHISRKDPAKAEAAIGDFALYLRHNMDSITVDHLIPFEDELEHVRRYVDLQKLRFQDDLDVRYDLECTDFSIPALTLQPLVENAITYGIRKSESGTGTVTIRTHRYPGHVEVNVTDNGCGFVPGAIPDDTSKSHTGISNVRERLRLVSGGELRLESEPGKGTEVTIVLPQEGM